MGSQGGAIQEPKSGSLARQGSSLYNLTLDEVQNQLGNLGKPLGSMNLDELLRSVWTAEAGGQASGLCSCGTDDADTQQQQQQQQQHGQVAPAVSALNPQGSMTLSGDLSKKTIDEVWRDMQRKKGGGAGNNDGKTQERQPTLGEMTLEDFLVKAGVVAESFGTAAEDNAIMSTVESGVAASQQNISQHAHWMQYQLPSVQPPPQNQPHQQGNMMAGFMAGPVVQQSFPVAVNPVLDAGYSENMVTMSPSSLMGTLSDTQAPGRKRVASGNVVEKTVERRQKRMIKNRESAARSRARKQAYTQELEIKVSRLEEENERLRRQHEIERALPSVPPPDPKHQLRRTSSAPL